jgi:hypothetical protein
MVAVVTATNIGFEFIAVQSIPCEMQQYTFSSLYRAQRHLKSIMEMKRGGV